MTKATFRSRMHKILAFIEAPADSDKTCLATGDIRGIVFEETVHSPSRSLSLGFLLAQRVESMQEITAQGLSERHS